jgi:hypothetical protein
VRDGRLRANIGTVATLDDAVAAFTRPRDARGKRSFAFDRGDSGRVSILPCSWMTLIKL